MKDINRVDIDTLGLEAVTALAGIESSTDLDKRTGILRERATVDTENLAAFIVAVPEDLSPKARASFIRVITDGMEKLTSDARAQAAYVEMWEHE